MCHGETGVGNGAMADLLKNPPPDLTRITERYGKFPTDQILAKVVQALGESLLVHDKDKQGHSYIDPIHDSLINYWSTCLHWRGWA